MQRGPPLEVLCHLTFDHAQISMGRKNGRRTDSILRVGSMDFVEEVVTSNSPTRSSCSFPLSSTGELAVSQVGQLILKLGSVFGVARELEGYELSTSHLAELAQLFNLLIAVVCICGRQGCLIDT